MRVLFCLKLFGYGFVLASWAPIQAAFVPNLLLTSGATLLGTVDRRDDIVDVTHSILSRDQTYLFSYADPSIPGSVEQGSSEAQGTDTYGTLHATVSTSQTGNITSPLATVFSSGLWQDALTFNTSSNGTVVLIFHLTGSSTSSSNPGADGPQSSALVRFYGGAVGAGTFQNYLVTNSSLDTLYTSAAIPFNPGVPVQVEGSVGTNLTLFCSASINPNACASWSGSGILDFGHTAILSGIELFDQNHAPIQSFTVTSQSGTTYTSQGVVPEPNSLVLVGVGLITLFLRRKLNRRQER